MNYIVYNENNSLSKLYQYFNNFMPNIVPVDFIYPDNDIYALPRITKKR